MHSDQFEKMEIMHWKIPPREEENISRYHLGQKIRKVEEKKGEHAKEKEERAKMRKEEVQGKTNAKRAD
jgi:hypothetical protein